MQLIVPKHYQSLADRHYKNKKLKIFNLGEAISSVTQIKTGLELYGIADTVIISSGVLKPAQTSCNRAQLFPATLSMVSPR